MFPQGPGSVSGQQKNDVDEEKAAEDFMEGMAASASKQGTAIDVLAIGIPPEHTTLLSRLASETGGVLLLRQGD